MLLRKIFYLTLISVSFLCGKTTTIKVFHVFSSLGDIETAELKNSIILKYDENGAMTDSSIFTHTLPLSEKYIYVAGPSEGLRLRRQYERERVLSYRFENDDNGRRLSASLYGIEDTLYWKEFLKYDEDGRLEKRIRHNPSKAINPEMMSKKNESGDMIWGESYQYDSTGSIKTIREFYDDYILEVSTYQIDSLKTPKKTQEYFDPSVIFRTEYIYNNNGLLSHKITVERMGKSLESKKYNYDELGRIKRIKIFNSDGVLSEIIISVFDDKDFKISKFTADSTMKIIEKTEIKLDNKGRHLVVAHLDGNGGLMGKKIYSYDENDQIVQITRYDMIHRKNENSEIPVTVMTYEYE